MMHKRTLHSLLIVSFIVAIAASSSFAANEVIVESRVGLQRCADYDVAVTANLDQDISAVEVLLVVDQAVDCGFLEGLNVVWDLDMAVLQNRVIDLSMVDGTAPDYIRFAAMSTGQTPDYLLQGTDVAIASIEFTTSDCCEGTASIDPWVIDADPPFGVIQTQFVDAATSTLIIPTVTAATVAIANTAPYFTDAPTGDIEISWTEVFNYAVVAGDDDACEALSFSIESGPAGMTISPTGALQYDPTGDDICEFDGDIVLRVTDKCGDFADAEAFTLCVTNEPPAFDPDGTYPTTMTTIGWGDTYSTTVVAVDPDMGPLGPIYSIEGWAYAASPPSIDPNTGYIEWTTGYSPEYSGIFDITVRASDGANVCDCSPDNYTEVTFQVEVNAFQVSIMKMEDVILGQQVVVPVYILDEMYYQPDIAGFDLLIQYDPSAMTFLFAEAGDFLTGCQWEYFTYRYGPNGNCGPGACPSGVLRIVGLAETTGGDLGHSPICTNNDPSGEVLANLTFLVSNNATLECQFAPIRFVWYDCNDNAFSTDRGDSLLISESVWEFAGFADYPANTIPTYEQILTLDQTFPTLTGAPTMGDDACDVEFKTQPWRLVHFYNGGLDIICADSIDAVGDINLNLIAYEIADAVMFTNYFLEGLTAFPYHPDYGYAGSIAASDTNKDGITLSVADLVYLIRVIVGDALPYAKIHPVEARITYGNGTFGVGTEMGAAHVVVEGNRTPRSLVDNMEMRYHFDGTNTSILFYSFNAGQTFTGDFLQVDGRIVSTEFATYDGQPVVGKLMPTTFEVGQNYPNPFNPGTVIEFQIPNGGAWQVDIYNIAGQLVKNFSGNSESGFVTLEWNASDLSSGVYFYRVSDGRNSMTKKAVLLK